MEVKLSNKELEDIFSRSGEALLTIDGEYFIDANQAALDLICASSLKVFRSLHPAMISPEFQPDGESSKIKAEKMISFARENVYNRFKWQHINLHKEPFDVEVTLRKREVNGKELIDVHWLLLSE